MNKKEIVNIKKKIQFIISVKIHMYSSSWIKVYNILNNSDAEFKDAYLKSMCHYIETNDYVLCYKYLCEYQEKLEKLINS